jgi:hypothetical protein
MRAAALMRLTSALCCRGCRAFLGAEVKDLPGWSFSQIGRLTTHAQCEMLLPVWEFVVRLIGRAKLASLSERDGETAKWIAGWIGELRVASWKRPTDVRGQFPRAFQRSDGTFLFPVLQHQVGIDVLIDFSQSVALIVAIKILEDANGH